MGDTGPVLPSCPQSCGGLSHGSGQVPLTQSAPPCWARGEVKLCGLNAPRPLDPSLPPRRLSSALCPALPPGSGSRPARAFAARPRSRGQGPPLRSGPCPDPHRLSRSARGRPFPAASPPARGCAAGHRTVRRLAPEAPGPRAGGGAGLTPRGAARGSPVPPPPALRTSRRKGKTGKTGQGAPRWRGSGPVRIGLPAALFREQPPPPGPHGQDVA